MGDRYISYYDCPKCGEEVELYDAPSSVMYVAICDKCGWREPLNYYEVADNEIVLCTKEEYNKKYKHTDWCQDYRNSIKEWIKSDRSDK